jgi:hypothetical protein
MKPGENLGRHALSQWLESHRLTCAAQNAADRVPTHAALGIDPS